MSAVADIEYGSPSCKLDSGRSASQLEPVACPPKSLDGRILRRIDAFRAVPFDATIEGPRVVARRFVFHSSLLGAVTAERSLVSLRVAAELAGRGFRS